MRHYLLVSALMLAVTPASSQAFNLSFVQDLLDSVGVNVDLPEIHVDLPPRAERAVDSALDRAESILDDVFGDNGVVNGIGLDLPNNLPEVNVPDVSPIVDEALASARRAQSSALSRAQSRAQSAVDSALGRASRVLDGINLPNVVTDVDRIVEDALDDAQSAADRALSRGNSILDDLDLPSVLPDVDQIVEDALGDAQSAVDRALDRADAAVGNALSDADRILEDLNLGSLGNTVDSALENASGVVDEILGEGGLVDEILSDLSISFSSLSVGGFSLPLVGVSGATAVPEPAGLGLAALGLLAMAPRRR